MLKRNQEGLKIANIFSDLLLFILCCFLSRQLRFTVLEGKETLTASLGTMFLLMAVFSLLSVFCLYLSNIYAP